MSVSELCGRSWPDRAGFCIALGFLLVASIPGTIALRYGLQALSLILICFSLRDQLPLLWREERWSSFLLFGFVAWAGVHTALIAKWPDYAWGEYRNQLLVSALWGIAGWCIFRRRSGASILDMVIAAGTLTALAEFVIEAWKWHQTGFWPYQVTFMTVTHLEFTYLMNMVLGFVLVTLCFGFHKHTRLTRFSRLSLSVFAVLIVFVSMRAAARNGMIGLVYMSFSMLLVYLIFEGKRLGRTRCTVIVVSVLVLLSGLSVFSIKNDSRNSVFVGSVKAGWNYEPTRAWLDLEPLPKLSDGREVDDSAYKRVAWIHSGLRLIAHDPIGYGYGRGAFSRALTSIGYANNVGHSHSGIIDLGVGLGIPGIVLWLAYCWTLVVAGFRAFASRGETLGLVLMLASCGFIGRMMIESIQRDHMLSLFLFVMSALLAEMHARQEAAGHVVKN
jgi:hypothetical protein